jgi:geranylgeranyl diphosphate synthase type I
VSDHHDLDIDRLARLIAATGAVDRIEDMIHAWVAAARAAIHDAPIDRAARRALAELAVAVTRGRPMTC